MFGYIFRCNTSDVLIESFESLLIFDPLLMILSRYSFQYVVFKVRGTPQARLLSANGDGEIRTLDPLLARQVLSQLSYTPSDLATCSAVSSIVPSADWVLTVVFGMGTGVSPNRIGTRILQNLFKSESFLIGSPKSFAFSRSRLRRLIRFIQSTPRQARRFFLILFAQSLTIHEDSTVFKTLTLFIP